MTFLKPYDSVHVDITIPRWQKHWISKRNSLNYSGAVQDMNSEMIKLLDPEYFKKYNKSAK